MTGRWKAANSSYVTACWPGSVMTWSVASGLHLLSRPEPPGSRSQSAREALTTWTCVPRMARAVQRRRPRIGVGSALVVAGAVARLGAAAAEPLR
jgi:hypothetical protein